MQAISEGPPARGDRFNSAGHGEETAKERRRRKGPAAGKKQQHGRHTRSSLEREGIIAGDGREQALDSEELHQRELEAAKKEQQAEEHARQLLEGEEAAAAKKQQQAAAKASKKQQKKAARWRFDSSA